MDTTHLLPERQRAVITTVRPDAAGQCSSPVRWHLLDDEDVALPRLAARAPARALRVTACAKRAPSYVQPARTGGPSKTRASGCTPRPLSSPA